ncbi:threonine ammonia-lyase, biosynthetic [Basilea psittacipulmonis]|uniref:L-threonine dehydratase n=1 Tax=Basilea psittacipulmonis DSM 24701 TaxID=1072685 RepID=A0A077DFI7_9BURK|nr:threonine ammonia-lyase, biosynthetic [Basilea psittacipulmonis]AIL32132.1 threonine dehydratase [Basilea psittacipulmonis DSM 24701]
MKTNDYLKLILTSHVYDVAQETPLEKAKLLSQRLKNTVLLKREDTQPVFSFKLRGAYNKMSHLSTAQIEQGVIAASAGNHAQGVAMSAQKMGCKAVIVMPISTPKVKVEAVKRFGAQAVLHGDSYTDAYDYAKKLEKEEGLTFVHPFDDPYVIAGQGTIGMEIMRQYSGKIDAIFCPIGGGGLISGVAAYIKALHPQVKVIGVQTEDSCAMLRSIKANRRLKLSDVGLFSDGTAVKQVGAETFKLVKSLVDDFVTVDTYALCASIRDVFQDTRSILEPSGALALAGAEAYIKAHGWEGKTVVAINSGANMNFDRLRFVSERADAGAYKEALFSVTMPEKQGSFRKLCRAIGSRSVTEFSYRLADKEIAHVLVGIQIDSKEEIQKVAEQIRKKGFEVEDLSNDDLTKSHLRFLCGGKSGLADDEVLYRIQFPERPGALMRFLQTMQPNWNISLFHYRNVGSDMGSVLIGMQVPVPERPAFLKALDSIGYPYSEQTKNPMYKAFLQN